MDEANEILLSSLKSSGICLPVGVSSIKDFSSVVLVSICAQSLRLILDPGAPSLPISLPAATAERFKFCAELATAIKSIGYAEELGFHQFLYPSNEESYKLVRFLVERLSKESSEGKKVDTARSGKLNPENNKAFTSCFRGSNDKTISCQEGTSQDLSDGDKSFIYGPGRKWLLQQEQFPRTVGEQSLKEKKMKLEQTFFSEQPGVQEKLIQLKEIDQEIVVTLAEISKREAEHLDLLKKFEEQPKLPSRKSYIERITEITKNSQKLDSDIKQILKETRELQLESNAIQERLYRTHAVVDETVFREAKKDAVGRQAYRLITSIHDSFQQIADTILVTDRARREAAGHEAKLAGLSTRGFDIAKLQADLDSIKKENELLEQKCHKASPVP